jgi:hypothetical protein
MILGRQKDFAGTPSRTCSKDKNKSLIRIPSNSKLPKDFFKIETPNK